MKRPPPGCPSRLVTEIKLDRGGAFLTLACGHGIWEGGFDKAAAERAVVNQQHRISLARHCLTGPCYKHQTPMGIHCGYPG